MVIANYFKASFSRKIARRFFKKYQYSINNFLLPADGEIAFANWQNPLIKPYTITQHEVDFFKSLFPAGSLVIDIGAHVGSLTVPMAIANGKNGLVLAFEPNPQVFEGLALNASLNKEKYTIQPLQFGVADEEANFHYASSEASLSNGGLVFGKDDNSLGKHKLKGQIKTVRLSKLLQEHYANWLDKLRFIKIDAEGFDLAILRDIKPLLAQYHPVVITEVFYSKHRKLSKPEREEIF